jgi:hypothetical protein
VNNFQSEVSLWWTPGPFTFSLGYNFTGVAAMIAVSAMACQFALLRLAVPGAPSTAVMTGNLTSSVLSLLDRLSRSQPLKEGANERLKGRHSSSSVSLQAALRAPQQSLCSEIGRGHSPSYWPRG